MFMALTERNPIITSRMKKFIALGPVAYVEHMYSPFFRALSLMPWLV